MTESATELETIEIETSAEPTATVIWLHGLGADGNDFVPVVPELKLPNDFGIRFIFPNAPHQPVSCNGGLCYAILVRHIFFKRFRKGR